MTIPPENALTYQLYLYGTFIFIFPYKHKYKECHKNKRYHCPEPEHASRNQSSNLVNAKRHKPCKQILEQNCKPEPLSAVKFLTHYTNCRNTRRIKQIEQKETESTYCTREPCIYRNCNSICFFYKFFAHICKNAHSTDDCFFCTESGNACSSCLPSTIFAAKSKRNKNPANCVSDYSHNRIRCIN